MFLRIHLICFLKPAFLVVKYWSSSILSHFIYLNIYNIIYSQLKFSFSSVQFSRSVVSDSLPPHELQHTRPPCPSPTPGVHSDSCPSSQWCHPAISSSVVPWSSCPQSLPASESFPKFSLNCSNISSSLTDSSLTVDLSAVSHLSLNFIINFII